MNLSTKYTEQRKVINKIKEAETLANSTKRFEGTGIVATFGGTVVGELQAITYTLDRPRNEPRVIGGFSANQVNYLQSILPEGESVSDIVRSAFNRG